MKHVVALLLLVVLAWQGYGKDQQATARSQAVPPPASHLAAERPENRPERPASNTFRCDGRIYCSQMTSCDEATRVLHNCPGTKMDGDNDGIPCERQWCQ